MRSDAADWSGGDGEAGHLPDEDGLGVPGDLQQAAGQPGGKVRPEAHHQPGSGDADAGHLPELPEEVLDDGAPLPAAGEVVRLDEDLVGGGEGGEVLEVGVGVD